MTKTTTMINLVAALGLGLAAALVGSPASAAVPTDAAALETLRPTGLRSVLPRSEVFSRAASLLDGASEQDARTAASRR